MRSEFVMNDFDVELFAKGKALGIYGAFARKFPSLAASLNDLIAFFCPLPAK